MNMSLCRTSSLYNAYLAPCTKKPPPFVEFYFLLPYLLNLCTAPRFQFIPQMFLSSVLILMPCYKLGLGLTIEFFRLVFFD